MLIEIIIIYLILLINKEKLFLTSYMGKLKYYRLIV